MVPHENLDNFLINFIVMGASSSIAKTLTAPLDRIKLILQNQNSALHIVTGQTKKYTNFSDCLIRIPKEQGMSSLWRGNFVNVVRYFPAQSLNFAFNDLFKNELSKRESENTTIAYIAGGLSGGASVIAVYPLKFCQTRISLDMGGGQSTVKRSYEGLTDCIQKVSRREGFMGMYRGLSVAFISSMIYNSIYFGSFDSLKHYYHCHYSDNRPPIWLEFMFAQIVTVGSTLTIYPMDTIGRRYMLDSGQDSKFRAFSGPWQAFKIVYTKEGLKSFYRGCLTSCLHGLCGAIILVFHDEFLYYTNLRKSIKEYKKCQ